MICSADMQRAYLPRILQGSAYLPVVTLAFMSGTKMWNWKPVAEGLCDIKVGLLALGLNLFFILSSLILSLLCLMGIA